LNCRTLYGKNVTEGSATTTASNWRQDTSEDEWKHCGKGNDQSHSSEDYKKGDQDNLKRLVHGWPTELTVQISLAKLSKRYQTQTDNGEDNSPVFNANEKEIVDQALANFPSCFSVYHNSFRSSIQVAAYKPRDDAG